jgi:hypothetical protein
MYKETFLPIGVAIVAPQKKLWEDRIIIVMPYGSYIAISHNTKVIRHVLGHILFVLEFHGLGA